MAPLQPPEDSQLPVLPEIRDINIRQRVFTHRSLHGRPTSLFKDPDDEDLLDNERLEFLGDSILSCVTTAILQKGWDKLRVGPTSKIRSLIICNENLALICKRYGLQERLKGAYAQKLTLQTSAQVQADLFESYIAGVFLDSGYESVVEWLQPLLEPYVFSAIKVVEDEHLLSRRSPFPEEGEIPPPNPFAASQDIGLKPDPGTLSYFNQWCQKKKVDVKWEQQAYNTNTPTPVWEMTVLVDNVPWGSGRSTTKKNAKVLAARNAMTAHNITIE